MKNYILKQVAILLHHANKRSTIFGESKKFYAEKERILNKYGTFLGYEIQHIAGKKCYSCNGSGKTYEDYYSYEIVDCCDCCSGWYKIPFTSVLEKYEFMGLYFHIPKERVFSYNKDRLNTYNVIGEVHGYITHAEPDIRLAKLFYLFFLPKVFFQGIKSSIKWYLHDMRMLCADFFKALLKRLKKDNEYVFNDNDLAF